MRDRYDEDWQPEQVGALIEELQSIHRLIELGIAEVHQLSGTNEFIQGALYLLSQGFERLQKATWIVAQCSLGHAIPTAGDLKYKFGHDLVRLNEELVAHGRSVSAFASIPIAVEDATFMSEDEDLREQLEIFTSFSSRGRYHDLDLIVGPAAPADESSPTQRWWDLEMRHWDSSRASIDHIVVGDSEIVHEQLNRKLTSTLDRYARALARMWFLGALAPNAKSPAVGSLDRWLPLADDELGTKRALGHWQPGLTPER